MRACVPLTHFGYKTRFHLVLSSSFPHIKGNAFGCFDAEGSKTIAEDQLKSILTTMGQDKMTEEEVEEFMAVAPFDAAGNFQYGEFVHTLKHGGRKA